MDIVYWLLDFAFSWDEGKARSNFAKHGVTFDEAAGAFLDPFGWGGDASAAGERRDFILGYTLAQRLLHVVYVERKGVVRIISARPATHAERRQYERPG